MRALITGSTGFVGQHLASYLMNYGIEVWGTTRDNFNGIIPGMKIVPVDFENVGSLVKVLDDVQPDFIYHLAGQSSVKDSWTDKSTTFQSNVNLTIHLLEAVINSTIKGKLKS